MQSSTENRASKHDCKRLLVVLPLTNFVVLKLELIEFLCPLIFLPVIQEVTRFLSLSRTSWSILDTKVLCNSARKGHMQFYMTWSMGMTPGSVSNILISSFVP